MRRQQQHTRFRAETNNDLLSLPVGYSYARENKCIASPANGKEIIRPRCIHE